MGNFSPFDDPRKKQMMSKMLNLRKTDFFGMLHLHFGRFRFFDDLKHFQPNSW